MVLKDGYDHRNKTLRTKEILFLLFNQVERYKHVIKGHPETQGDKQIQRVKNDEAGPGGCLSHEPHGLSLTHTETPYSGAGWRKWTLQFHPYFLTFIPPHTCEAPVLNYLFQVFLLLIISGILYRTVLTCPQTHSSAPTLGELTSDSHTQTFRYMSTPTHNNNK